MHGWAYYSRRHYFLKKLMEDFCKFFEHLYDYEQQSGQTDHPNFSSTSKMGTRLSEIHTFFYLENETFSYHCMVRFRLGLGLGLGLGRWSEGWSEKVLSGKTLSGKVSPNQIKICYVARYCMIILVDDSRLPCLILLNDL